MSRLDRVRTAATGLLVASVLLSCSGSAPEILFPDTRLSLVLDPASGSVAEVLRLFVAVRDSDGTGDPARIFVINDESGLYWEIDSETWVALQYGGDDWYGVPDLRLPDGGYLPRGRYRLIVEDQSLSRDEAEFFITAEREARDEPFPRLALDESPPRVVFSAPVVVRAYARDGQLIVERVVAPGALPQDFLARIPEETGVQLFVSSTGDRMRRQTGPYAAP